MVCRRALIAASLAALAMSLAACGGGSGSGGAGTPPTGEAPPPPPPPPPPTPPPGAFAPVVAQIFTDPLLTPEIVSMAEGWRYEWNSAAGGPSTNVGEDDGGGLVFDPAASNYRATIPLLGTGVLFQTNAAGTFWVGEHLGAGYSATIADNASAATNRTELWVFRPNDFQHVAYLSWYAIQSLGGDQYRASSGIVALAQPTQQDRIPASAMRSYAGPLLAYLSGDDSAVVVGTVEIQVDFGAPSLRVGMTLAHQCFMGCSYPGTVQTAPSVDFVRGSTTFSGALAAPGATTNGLFSGRFAGPGAEELVIRFQTPYFDPDRGRWTTIAGIALARQR